MRKDKHGARNNNPHPDFPYLAEWRACIEQFIRANISAGFQGEVADIGMGDSTVVLQQLVGNNVVIIDKNYREHELKYIVGDLTDINTLTNVGKFDIVCMMEVLEHLERPFTAAENAYSLLKEGGKLLVTVPTILKWHPGMHFYRDYWRFMPESLTQLFHFAKSVEETVYNSPIDGVPYGIAAVVK